MHQLESLAHPPIHQLCVRASQILGRLRDGLLNFLELLPQLHEVHVQVSHLGGWTHQSWRDGGGSRHDRRWRLIRRFHRRLQSESHIAGRKCSRSRQRKGITCPIETCREKEQRAPKEGRSQAEERRSEVACRGEEAVSEGKDGRKEAGSRFEGGLLTTRSPLKGHREYLFAPGANYSQKDRVATKVGLKLGNRLPKDTRCWGCSARCTCESCALLRRVHLISLARLLRRDFCDLTHDGLNPICLSSHRDIQPFPNPFSFSRSTTHSGHTPPLWSLVSPAKYMSIILTANSI